jgi:spoIIIJ-associated protein
LESNILLPGGEAWFRKRVRSQPGSEGIENQSLKSRKYPRKVLRLLQLRKYPRKMLRLLQLRKEWTMESLEISGKTVEEAIQHALKQLGLSRDEVEVVVLKEGRTGVLGLGAEEARVIVKPLVPTPGEADNIVETAKGVIERLLAAMDVSASVVHYTEPSAQGENAATTPIAFNIKGDDLGILIGRRGQTLSSLQYIVRIIVSHQVKNDVLITIDVEGYKQRRYESLRTLAQRLANERRIIHLALSDHPDVSTHSIGVGEDRKVVIEPKKR